MSVLAELLESRDALQSELDGILRTEQGEDRAELSDEQEARSRELIDEIEQVDPRIAEETRKAEKAKLLAEARKHIVTEPALSTQVDEPRVYGKRSRHSWVYDQYALSCLSPFDQRHQDAAARQVEWSHQVERELADGSTAGVEAEKQVRSQFRDNNAPIDGVIAEFRERGRTSMEQKAEVRTGITTGGGATASAAGGGAAAFVSPVIFINEYAPYREAGRAFINQLHQQPLPDYGMELYLPYVSGPAAVGAQTEGSSVTETDPTMGFLSGAVGTEAGQVTVSQQSLDRTGPGFEFDRLIFDQLARDYDPKLDAFALTQVLAVATSQPYTGTFALTVASGVGGFLGMVSGAISTINTAAGTFLNPTHVFVLPSRWQYIAAYADGQGRQVIVPEKYGPFNASGTADGVGSPVIEGYTGYSLAGLPVFKDNNIPLLGTTSTDQAIVGDLSEVYWFEGAPVDRVLPQTLGGNLQVIIQRYGYRGMIVRYPAGVVSINGTAMATPTF